MKNYFRQKKKTGITKLKSKSSTSSKKKSAKSAAASSLDLQDDYDANEKILRQFDMNMFYGPCIGMSRLERWQRAEALGLNPPKEVENLLKSGEVRLECLWKDRM